MREMTFDEKMADIRQKIKILAEYLLFTKHQVSRTPENNNEERGEVLANLTLSYRHLEDASMRIGKVLQYRKGGVSIYDKGQTTSDAAVLVRVIKIYEKILKTNLDR